MSEWTDTLNSRNNGDVPGFVGANESIPDAHERTARVEAGDTEPPAVDTSLSPTSVPFDQVEADTSGPDFESELAKKDAEIKRLQAEIVERDTQWPQLGEPVDLAGTADGDNSGSE